MKPSKHDIEKVSHDLDLEESLDMHIRRWQIRRYAALLLFAIVIAAWLGLFGDGPLSHARQVKDGNVVTYERFMRFNKTVQMEFRVNEGAAVRLPLEYLAHFRIERIVPEPRSEQAGKDDIRFVFDTANGMVVRFHLMPDEIGLVRTRISVNDVAFPVTQFIYP